MAEGDKAASVENIPPSLRRPSAPASAAAPAASLTALERKYGLSATVADSGDPRVWLSDEQENIDPSQWPTVSQASTAYASLSPEAFKKLTSTLDKYYGKGRWNASYIKNFWAEALQINSNALLRGEKIPVLESFDNVLQQYADAGLTPSGGGGGGPKVTKAVKLTDPQTAETLVDQALQQYLGRKASDQEVKTFRKALGAAERGAPTEVDVMGDTQVTSGGFNPAVFAQQYAEGMEGAAEYQAATTFLDAFIGAIGPRVEL